MKKYAYWNNKGGTGKTSLAFQSVAIFAERNKQAKILVVDLCPQANISELFLGGLLGQGSENLLKLQGYSPRKTVGGYFQERLPSPYSMPQINSQDFISKPYQFNQNISENIDLLAGDALVELQSNAISTLANTQIPGTDTWLKIVDWLNDFIKSLNNDYDYIFVDANPSFSIYTQIALAAVDSVILPVMADDSSRRAVQNAFSLVHGINLPSAIYSQHNFSSRLTAAGRATPQFHVFPKNRLTQYMGSASAYHSVLTSIDHMISAILSSSPSVFSFSNINDGIVELRDFQTTGVVAFAFGLPFTALKPGKYNMPDRETQIRADYLQNCIDSMNMLISKL
ncbi:ParA family protein [Leptolyngbya sp. GB1-A1]|uniref:ParA family protein n=1 Tax=Leptolyngbya sp. GB1-A1 TaxID=2933908 RepID=UPI00329A533D